VKIANGPLYDLAEVTALAEAMKVLLWTKKCIQNVNDLYVAVSDEYDSQLAMVAEKILCRPPGGDKGRGTS
jgi:virulence-associated protein VapD